MTMAAVYIRVSTEEQTEFSPDAQLRAIRQYAEKNGYTIEDENIFRDEGISGRRADKRPGFQRMVGLAKTKPTPFDVILVHKFDRFARSREDSIVYKSLLKRECNVRVISITEQLEDDKFSVILEAMLEAMAEYYSLNLSEEVKKGMTEKARRGELQTPAPFGYRMLDGLLTPNEEEAEVVKEIFRKYAKENINMRAIAKHINALGFKTKMGNSFDTRLIEYIIYNPTYIGKMRWTPTGSVVNKHDFDNPDTMVIDGKHEAIVDEAIWQEANRLIRAKKKNKIPQYERDGEITTHWLRGILRCSECGTTLSYGKGNSGKQGAYRCNRYLVGGCKAPQRITISKAEEAVINTLKSDAEDFTQSEFNQIMTVSNTNQTELERYQKRQIKLNAQLEKARELVLSGIDTPEEYKDNKAKINIQINEVTTKISELSENQKYENVAVFREKIRTVVEILVSDASLTDKNNAIRQIVSKIVYDKTNETLAFYYYYLSE